MYHVSVDPISKFDRFTIVKETYGTDTEIEPDDSVRIDRSLNSDRFRRDNGLFAPSLEGSDYQMRKFGMGPGYRGEMMFSGKTLLITGGTGSFGNAVIQRFLTTDISQIRVFSRDEKKQEDMRLPSEIRSVEFLIGDVRDYDVIA